MTQLSASLDGRLRNTSLPQKRFLFPLFEAVVNSIYGIDDRIEKDKTFSPDSGYIEVKFIRDSQTSLNEKDKGYLERIVISDNGIGFTDDNYKSFCTLDSMYHASKGCRGIGRLLWLKEFAVVNVSSVYKEAGKLHKRSFKFSNEGIENEKVDDVEGDEPHTEIILSSPRKLYIDLYNKQSLDNMSKALFEHLLWFYIRKGGCPRIKLIDGKDEVDMDNLYEEYAMKSDNQTSIDIGGHTFNLLHVKVKKTEDKNRVFYCAGNRVVRIEKLNITGLYESPLKDGEQNFYYQCYVTSKYLDDNVSSDRYSFMINESKDKNQQELKFEGDLVFDDIMESVNAKIEEFLQPYLTENIEQGLIRVANYVDTKAPYYKPLLGSLSDKDKSLNPNSTDKSIDSYLHTKLYEQEHRLIEEGHDVLDVREHETDEQYKERVKDYFDRAQNLKSSDLVRYVIHRKIILEFLEDSLERKDDGKYSREDRVHQIIMPMHMTSDDVDSDNNNLWLINDRLVFHHYLASDKSFKSMEITDCESKDRPDIISEFVYDNPLVVAEGDNPPFASFSIIEFKRPMRDDFEENEKGKDPIKQCLNYVKLIRDSKVKDKRGRIIRINEHIPAYCYVISDLTSSLEEICELNDFTRTYDNLGYFGYKSNYRTYFEVISFDQLLNAAKERNAAFFDKLGISHK